MDRCICLSVYLSIYLSIYGLPKWCRGKEYTCNAGNTRDTGLILGLGRFPGVGNGNLLQHSPPWTEEPGRLQSMGSRLDVTEPLSTHTHIHMYIYTYIWNNLLFSRN